MRIMLGLIALFTLNLLSFGTSGENKVSKSYMSVFRQDAHGNSDITSDIMNGKPALFKTYQDFLNRKGEALTYEYDDVTRRHDHIVDYVLVFRDEANKKIKIKPGDFWGWRHSDGHVYRNAPFSFEGLTSISFEITYIAVDHILYAPKDVGGNGVASIFISEDLTMPIIESEKFFDSHSHESYSRIRKVKSECKRQFPVKSAFYTNAKMYEEWNQQITQCQLKTPDLVCIYNETSMNKMRTAGFGTYFFNGNAPLRH